MGQFFLLFFFNILTCDVIFDDIERDLANYEGLTTSYVYSLENIKVIKPFEKNTGKLSEWLLEITFKN